MMRVNREISMRIAGKSGFLSGVTLTVLLALPTSCKYHEGPGQLVPRDSSARVEKTRDEMPQTIANWEKRKVPLDKWADVITFEKDGCVAILSRQTITISLDNGRSWMPLNGGAVSHLTTVDGGSTYRDVNHLGEPLSSSVRARDICSVEGAVITTLGRLYVQTVCEHITQLWSVPTRNEADPWNVVSFTYERDPSDGVYTPGHNLSVAGDRVLIDASLPDGPALLTTDDHGATWYPFWRGSTSDTGIVGLSFIDNQVGWMLQGSGPLRKTTDGGRSWEYLSALSIDSARQTWSVDFANLQTGFIVGSDGLILTTIDGGKTWKRQGASTTLNLYKVAAADSNRVWVVGEKGTILETSDGGNHWQKVDLGITKDIRFGLTVKDGGAWIVSDDLMFHSP